VFGFDSGTISVHSHHEDCATHGLRIDTTFQVTGGTGAFQGASGGGREFSAAAAPHPSFTRGPSLSDRESTICGPRRRRGSWSYGKGDSNHGSNGASQSPPLPHDSTQPCSDSITRTGKALRLKSRRSRISAVLRRL
jgi:hypothetical protein